MYLVMNFKLYLYSWIVSPCIIVDGIIPSLNFEFTIASMKPVAIIAFITVFFFFFRNFKVILNLILNMYFWT